MFKVRPIGFLSTVGSAGVQERLTDSSLSVRALLLTAERSNSGFVYIGDKDVSSTRYGISLRAGESVEMSVETLGWDGAEIPLNEVWLDVSSSGDGVSAMYLDIVQA